MELYTKRNIEVNYNETKLEENNPILIYIQKIKMILFTRKGETPDFNFGVNLEQMLFKKNLDNTKIKNEIENQISGYCDEYREYETTVDVKFYQMNNHDECEINIMVNGINVIDIKTF